VFSLYQYPITKLVIILKKLMLYESKQNIGNLIPKPNHLTKFH